MSRMVAVLGGLETEAISGPRNRQATQDRFVAEPSAARSKARLQAEAESAERAEAQSQNASGSHARSISRQKLSTAEVWHCDRCDPEGLGLEPEPPGSPLMGLGSGGSEEKN